MSTADRSLADKAAHEVGEGIVAGDTELMLEIDHGLGIFHDHLLIVFLDALHLTLLVLKGVQGLRDVVLKHCDDVGFDRAGGYNGSPGQIIPCAGELSGGEMLGSSGKYSRRLLISIDPLLQGGNGLGQTVTGGAEVVHDLQVVQPGTQAFGHSRFGAALRTAGARWGNGRAATVRESRSGAKRTSRGNCCGLL